MQREYIRSQLDIMDPKLKAQIKEDYQERNLSMSLIANKYKLTIHQVKNLIYFGKWVRYQDRIKAEVRAYYESRPVSLEQLAKKFNIKLLDVKHWAKDWVPCAAINEVQEEVLNDSLTKHHLGTLLNTKKEEIKTTIKQNLNRLNVDPLVLECIAEESSEALLLKAMNINFMNKQMLKAAIIAKEELMKMAKCSLDQESPNPTLINAAERVVKIFSDLKISLYGKEVTLKVQQVNNNIKEMSTEELLEIANAPDIEEPTPEESTSVELRIEPTKEPTKEAFKKERATSVDIT